MLPLFILIALLSAFVIAIFGRKSSLFSDVVASVSTFILFVISLMVLYQFNKEGVIIYKVGGWIPPIGICLVLDGFSAFMLVILNFIAFLVCLYSTAYMNKYTDKFRFYSLFLLMVSGMNGVILTGDIFNLYIFLEIAFVAASALVAFGTETENFEAAFKYIVMGTVASCFILLGIGLLYSLTSSLNLADISLSLVSQGNTLVVLFISILFITGVGLKAGLVPFHAWLPDGYQSAPTPASTMFAGALTKVLGVYTLFRIFFNVFGPTHLMLNILMFLGGLSLLVGVFLAIGQRDFKRLLAYDSISQIGYAIVGVSTGVPLGIIGGLFHLFNHSMFKSLLFFDAGAVEYSTKSKELNKLGGLKEKMPVTFFTSWIASMSVSGIPPFSGFWSKLIIILACVQTNHIGYAIVAVIGSMVTLALFMKVHKSIFFGKLNPSFNDIKEVPFVMKFCMIVLVVFCIFGGLLILPKVSSKFIKPAADALAAGRQYSVAVLGR